MGFFSVLGDINRNKDNFKKWEQQERDNDAKRKALYEKGVGKERFEEAKRRGNVIIDAITQMDQHSENVAEDVETAVAQATGFTVIPLQIAALTTGGFLSRQGAKKLNQTTQDFLKTHDLSEIITEIQNNPATSKKYISTRKLELLNSKNLSYYKKYLNPQNYEVLSGYTKDWAKTAKPYKKYFIGAAGSVAGIFLGGILLMQYMGTKMQIGSSRIARWQSREALKDPKNFVIYTDEQIAQARENLKGEKEKSSFFSKLFGSNKKNIHKKGMIKNIKDVLRDKKAYEQWRATDTQEKVEGPLNDEQIKQAKLDKELIQRITRKINNKAEEYSENMESAAETLIGSSILGGAVLGGGLGWILEKTGLGEKLAYKKLEKYVGQDIVERIKNITKENISKIEKNGKLNRISAEIKEIFMEKIKQNKGGEGIWGAIEYIKNINKAARYPKFVSRAGRIANTAKSLTIVTTLIGALISLKLQKSAARAGRYIAKKEFKNNPQEFLSYTDEEMASVADVKGKTVTTGQKFKEWISFVPKSIQQMWEYNKYKKTELKQNEKLREELVKNAKVSDKQLQEAKNLQRKLYNTFEKVDEKSQSYSEYMEFANEAAQPYIIYGGITLALSPLIAAVIGVGTGKISIVKLMDWTTNLLAKFSKLTKGKLFKKHIAEMGQMANAIIDSVEIKSGDEFATNLYYKFRYSKDSAASKQLLKMLNINKSDLSQIDKNKFVEMINELKNKLPNLRNTIKEASSTTGILKKLQLDNITGLLNLRDNIKEILNNDELIAKINTFLEESASVRFAGLKLKGGKIDKKLIGNLVDRLDIIIKNFPKGEAEKAIMDVLVHITENPEKFITSMMENPQEFSKIIYTPTLKKIAAAIGISYGALVTLLTYLMVSKFASMQKDAGRLGVMKALDDLKDYRYYADEGLSGKKAQISIPQTAASQNTAQSSTQNSMQNQTKPLLKNYVKYVPRSAA